MNPTNFATILTSYFSFLQTQKNVSPNTIKAYRDSFRLLLVYLQEEKNIKPEKVTMETLSSSVVTGFLDWLENSRACSITTRNLRLAAIHSFFRYAQMEFPDMLLNSQQILSIPVKKKQKTAVEYLTHEGVKILLQQPDTKQKNGLRDLALLSTLYDSGARVQEIIDLRVKDFTSGKTPLLVLTGKGNKTRRVPLMKNTSSILEKYIKENNTSGTHIQEALIFCSRDGRKLTKEGVAYILNKYASLANKVSNSVPEHIHCHMLRHSKAMHLLQAGVNLIYIRDFLGHCDIKTTEIYARADTESKREALTNAYPELVDDKTIDWTKNGELMRWLASL